MISNYGQVYYKIIIEVCSFTVTKTILMKLSTKITFLPLLLVLLFLPVGTALAQIKGKVTDTNTDPVPFVNIVLYRVQDSTLVSGGVSDDEGNFELAWTTGGQYYVGASSLGYATFFSEPFVIREYQPFELETIVLTTNFDELEEVVVATQKNTIQHTSSGITINVQSSLMTQGSTALQVLERQSGVLVDRQNNQFSLNGQSGVTIMFNGKKMPMDMEGLLGLLETTSADNIEKIEIISVPTARYDANGSGGIINIIFKNNTNEGSQLHLGVTAGYGYGKKTMTSANYSYGKGKLAVNASYSFIHEKGKNGYEGYGSNNIPVLGGPSKGNFSTYTVWNQNINNSDMKLGWYPSDKTELGAEINYTFSRNHNVADANNTRDIEGENFFRSHLISSGNTAKNNLITSMYLATELNSKSKFNTGLNYVVYDNDNPRITQSAYLDEDGMPYDPNNPIFTEGTRSTSYSNIKLVSFTLDYTYLFSKASEFSFGIKGSHTDNTNNSNAELNTNGVWEVDPRSQSKITGKENLFAAYSQLKYLIGKKSEWNAGLRYEYWENKISTNRLYIINRIFPSISYQYIVNDKQTLQLGYYERIDRPAYSDLVANLYYNDPTAIFTGNPLLQPTLSKTLRLGYSYRGVHAGLSFIKETNPIIRYQMTSTPENDILVISPQNADYQKSMNLSLSIPWRWASWAKLDVSTLSAIRNYQLSYTPNIAETTYFYQSVNMQQNLNLPLHLEAELSGWYVFPHYNGTNKNQGFGILNFAISKEFNDGWGTLKFSVTDIFKSFIVKSHNGALTPLVFDIDSRSRYRDESAIARIFRLSYTVTLGKLSTSQKVGKPEYEEELKRIQ